MSLEISQILKYIAEGEHQQQDFKFCINDSRKIAKSLVAFANTDGGRLLIGVKDNGKIAGVKSDEEYYMVEAAAKIYSRPKIEITPIVWDVDGKVVLEVDIPKGLKKPYQAQGDDGKWLTYIRVDDENILANEILVKSWKLDKKGVTFKLDEPRKILMNHIESGQSITLGKFIRMAHITRTHAQEILAEFISMGCLVVDMKSTPVMYSLNEEWEAITNVDSI